MGVASQGLIIDLLRRTGSRCRLLPTALNAVMGPTAAPAVGGRLFAPSAFANNLVQNSSVSTPPLRVPPPFFNAPVCTVRRSRYWRNPPKFA